MSYILDALVKADRERQSQGVPGLHTIQLAPARERGLGRHWPSLLAAGVAVGGLLALAALFPGRGPASAPPASSQPAPLQPAAGPGREEPSPAASAPLQAATAPAPEAVKTPARAAESVFPVTAAARPAPRREAPRAAPAEKNPGTRGEPRLYNIAELPAAVQKEAQKIAVAGFAYASDEKERMAIINDRAWREGDEVTAGLRIEKISSDGVVFNLRGYRFRKGGA